MRIRDDLLAQTDRAKPAPDQWFDDNAVTIDILHSIEGDLSQKVALRSQELRDSETRNAIIAGVLIVALLVLVLLFTVAIARSMVAPLRRLRTEALEIAGFRLPDVVRKLRVSGDAPAEIRPIEVEGDDEIGDVARAFDQVHRQAVRLAGEEADLRSNISSMFVNLSRRTQTLVERQISLIDGLEKGEQDGGRLADLFKLDHLATRMRRNSENLLVLAGHEAARRRSQPAKLVDVVRAALSEVEGYERVQVKVHRTTSVLGSGANDLVHLVAELVENAIQFSPSNTNVVVSSSLIEGGGALLSVNDVGISMTEDELAEANRRLAEPPVVDVSVSRRMGLFVVGRLALRHGIRVQLRKGDGAGLIAMVLLPPTLISDGNRPPQPQRPAVRRPAPNSMPSNGMPANGVPSATPPTAYPRRRDVPLVHYLRLLRRRLRAVSALHRRHGRRRPPAVLRLERLPVVPEPAPVVSQPGPGGTAARPDAAGAPGTGRPNQPPSYPSQESTGVFPSFPGPVGPGSDGAVPDALHEARRRRVRGRSRRRRWTSICRSRLMESRSGGVPADLRRRGIRLVPQAAEERAGAIFGPGESDPHHKPYLWGGIRGGIPLRTPLSGRRLPPRAIPALAGTTSSGLPKRTPKANLVPGTAAQPQQPQRPAPMPPVSAERARSRLSSFQQGVRRGRAEVRGQEEQQ